MTLLQQVLDVLERGEVLCEVTAANMLRAAIEQGMVVVPATPTDECLQSMAVRYDHGLGIDGYYDQPLFLKSKYAATHAEKLEAAKSTMSQLYEEATGQGFYRPEAPKESL